MPVRVPPLQSQGQTLPFVGLYLPSPVFGHGQLYVGLSRVGDPSRIKVMVVDGREQGRFEGRDGVWTVNIVYPEVLADAQRLLRVSLEQRTPGGTCGECEDEREGEGVSEGEGDGEGEGADDGDCAMKDADGEEAEGLDGSDDVDRDAVDASIERTILAPLRRARTRSASRLHVPTGLLSREQAWSLAHASEHVATTHGEMVDPWDADQ